MAFLTMALKAKFKLKPLLQASRLAENSQVRPGQRIHLWFSAPLLLTLSPLFIWIANPTPFLASSSPFFSFPCLSAPLSYLILALFVVPSTDLGAQ